MPRFEKILVVGATGRLGSYLVPFLKQRGADVITVGRRPGVDILIDVTDVVGLTKTLETTRPNAIVNLAALVDVDRCETNHHDAYLVNSGLPETIAHWIRESGHDCHVVHISTDHVYDSPHPSMERDVIIRNVYAMTKRAGEMAWCGVSHTILRTNYVGRSVKSRAGLTDWLVGRVADGNTVSAFRDVYFSPLHVSELIEWIETILYIRPQGIFNLGSHGGCSKEDFAVRLISGVGLSTDMIQSASVDTAGLVACRPHGMVMDSSRIEQVVQRRVPTIEESIKKTIRDYVRNE